MINRAVALETSNRAIICLEHPNDSDVHGLLFHENMPSEGLITCNLCPRVWDGRAWISEEKYREAAASIARAGTSTAQLLGDDKPLTTAGVVYPLDDVTRPTDPMISRGEARMIRVEAMNFALATRAKQLNVPDGLKESTEELIASATAIEQWLLRDR